MNVHHTQAIDQDQQNNGYNEQGEYSGRGEYGKHGGFIGFSGNMGGRFGGRPSRSDCSKCYRSDHFSSDYLT